MFTYVYTQLMQEKGTYVQRCFTAHLASAYRFCGVFKLRAQDNTACTAKAGQEANQRKKKGKTTMKSI